MGHLQSRCSRCVRARSKAKELAKKERLKVKRQKHKERPAALKKKLDILFSRYIRLRDQGKPCVTSGRPWDSTAQCGHFVSRKWFAVRWDEQNAHSQSAAANMFEGGEQYAHGIAIDKMYGPGTADALWKKARQPFKLTPEFLKERLAYYEAKMQALEEVRSV
jgi:hypothetical protein